MKRLLLSIGFALLIVFGGISTVHAAYDPLSDVCKGVNDSGTCTADTNGQSGSNPLTGTNGTLLKITNVVAIIAGIAAVITLIIGGIQYMTAGGDPQKAASARKVIYGTIIGVVVIVSARLIVGTIAKGL